MERVSHAYPAWHLTRDTVTDLADLVSMLSASDLNASVLAIQPWADGLAGRIVALTSMRATLDARMFQPMSW